MNMRKVDCIWPLGARLGEGPCWISSDQALWFVDIKGQQIHRLQPQTNQKQSWSAPDQVSFILPHADGSLAVGLPGTIAHFSHATGRFEALCTIESHLPHNRTNDACVDHSGRLWFGSMDDRQAEPNGALYCWDGRSQPVAKDHGYVISNGPAFSPDGTTLYHTDTSRRLIYQFDVDEDGTVSCKRPLLEIETGAGWPDGTTIDADGCLWIALYGGWAARRYSPRGDLLKVVSFPCANVTKIAFGSRDLKTAYATTARDGVQAEALSSQPLAGGLFAFEADVPGLVQNSIVAR